MSKVIRRLLSPPSQRASINVVLRQSAIPLLVCATAMAQETPTFRADTALALVRFHVVNKNQYVTSLKPEDVVLLEDGAPRKFTVFENAVLGRAMPVELTLLFDTSGSVLDAGLMNPLAFKEDLLDNLVNVSVAVYGFAKNLDRYCRPTRDFIELQAAFAELGKRGGKHETIQVPLPPKRKADPRGGTWIYAAVAQASREAAATPGNATRLLLVFSDGFDNTNAHPEDAADVDRELGIAVYPVVLGHAILAERVRAEQQRLFGRNPRTPEISSATMDRLQGQEREIQEFARLAELTGGRSYDPPQMTLTVMRQVLSGLVGAVRTEYTVGFVPEASGAPRKHKLEVRLREKEMGRVSGGTKTVAH